MDFAQFVFKNQQIRTRAISWGLIRMTSCEERMVSGTAGDH